MNEQPTFADLDYQHKRRRIRREEFLERMDALIPWQRLEDRIGPHYFRAERGRRSPQLGAYELFYREISHKYESDREEIPYLMVITTSFRPL